MAAERSAAAWAGLRTDLLCRILERLPCIAHRAVFAAICFNWRSIAREHPPLLKQLPWLLLPSTAAEGPSFFCLLCRDLHRIALPDDVRGARCCGSFPGGWLVLALQQFRGYALHNLTTGQRVVLPDVLGGADDPVMITHAAARTQGEFCLAAAVTMSASNIVFWRPGMDRWSPPTPARQHGSGSWSAMVPRGAVCDVVYYSGHGLEGFHVLTDTEDLFVHIPEHDPEGAAPTTRLVTYHFPNHKATALPPVGEGAIIRYLVDHFGELLMVVRTVSPDGATLAFRFFRLTAPLQVDTHGNRVASWLEVSVPDGLVVLGRCSSRTYALPSLGTDGFYFLDDATSFHDVTRALDVATVLHATMEYPCSDMGWLGFLSLQVHRIFPERLPSEYSRAAWFFH